MIRLARWGNSTGLRLSKSVMQAAGLKTGDFVYVRLLDSGDIRVRPSKQVQVVAVNATLEAELSKPTEQEPW